MKISVSMQKNISDFIKDAKNVHGSKYDYSKVNYINNHTKVTITCRKHGDFEQIPNSHLNGRGCPKCAMERILNLNFIRRAKKNHNEYIDYSRVNYINSHTKVELICHKKDKEGNEHGIFYQLPYQHIQGYSCPKCALDTNRIKHQTTSSETFKEKGMKIHDGKYIYDLVNEENYNGIKKKVPIICKEHGVFWQTPDKHINSRQGCPKCKSSHLENNVRNILKEKNILFIEQKRFDWLGQLSLDFYIPSLNTAIECQGIQHFTPRDFAYKGNEWSNELYEKIIERDSRKNKLCKENGIELIYFTDCDDKIINEGKNKELYHDIIKSDEKLKEYIND